MVRVADRRVHLGKTFQSLVGLGRGQRQVLWRHLAGGDVLVVRGELDLAEELVRRQFPDLRGPRFERSIRRVRPEEQRAARIHERLVERALRSFRV